MMVWNFLKNSIYLIYSKILKINMPEKQGLRSKTKIGSQNQDWEPKPALGAQKLKFLFLTKSQRIAR